MNSNESFAAFCNRIATPISIRIADGNYTLPEEYNEFAPKFKNKLRALKSTFPSYAITFVQSAFDDMSKVIKTLEEKTVDGEIPDALLVYYAYNMYTDFDQDGKPIPGKVVAYNDLPAPLQNIIKVMAVYTMLQI